MAKKQRLRFWLHMGHGELTVGLFLAHPSLSLVDDEVPVAIGEAVMVGQLPDDFIPRGAADWTLGRLRSWCRQFPPITTLEFRDVLIGYPLDEQPTPVE